MTEIAVRNGDGSAVETIHRKTWTSQVGNFVATYCTYRNRRCLIEFDHNEQPFIRPRNQFGVVEDTWDDQPPPTTVYQCLQLNAGRQVLAHEARTEAEAIRWLETNGGGIYRNLLHGFKMPVSAEAK